MGAVLSILTISDWLILALIALVLGLMAVGLPMIRREMRSAARLQAQFLVLKTTADQRRRWRCDAPPRDLLALLDDVESLLDRAGLRDAVARQEHSEAVKLAWRSRHIPLGMLLIAGVILAGAASAILMVVAQGPANPIP